MHWTKWTIFEHPYPYVLLLLFGVNQRNTYFFCSPGAVGVDVLTGNDTRPRGLLLDLDNAFSSMNRVCRHFRNVCVMSERTHFNASLATAHTTPRYKQLCSRAKMAAMENNLWKRGVQETFETLIFIEDDELN